MKKKSLTLLILPTLLCSCTHKVPLSFEKYKNDYQVEETCKDEETDVYKQSKSWDSVKLPLASSTGLTEISSLKQVLSCHDGKNVFNSTGDLKLLVIPVAFKGQEAVQREEKRILIQNAFFGDESRNSYESVASYYNKSSYGKVRISGEVTDWFTVDMTLEEALRAGKKSGETVSRIIAGAGFNWAKRELGEEEIRKYDTDNDDVIDAIYYVYDYPQDDGSSGEERNALLWAYFDKLNRNTAEGYNTTSPYMSSYSWSSFYFTGNKALSSHVVESNTFIHETGHIFGLEDYYNTEPKSRGGIYQPTGFMDMMDYNLGDHSSFSKYVLGWTTPKVVKDEGEITLKSFSQTGDFVLIPSKNWNGTPFDEYLLLEYYTPNGLNDAFSFPTYSYFDGDNNQRIFSYPTRHGLRVYHVDARLAYRDSLSPQARDIWIDDSGLEYWYSPENPDKHNSKYIDLLNTNGTTGSVDKSTPVLVHLLEEGDKDNFYKGIASSNSTMFGLNSSFGYDSFQDFVFNKKYEKDEINKSPFKFKITKLSSDEITISFERN